MKQFINLAYLIAPPLPVACQVFLLSCSCLLFYGTSTRENTTTYNNYLTSIRQSRDILDDTPVHGTRRSRDIADDTPPVHGARRAVHYIATGS